MGDDLTSQPLWGGGVNNTLEVRSALKTTAVGLLGCSKKISDKEYCLFVGQWPPTVGQYSLNLDFCGANLQLVLAYQIQLSKANTPKCKRNRKPSFAFD